MTNKSDKPLVRNWIIGCILLLLIFHFAWLPALLINLGSFWFTLVEILLLGGIGYGMYSGYKNADDPNHDWKRKLFIFGSAICSAWVGIWNSQLTMDIVEGIK